MSRRLLAILALSLACSVNAQKAQKRNKPESGLLATLQDITVTATRTERDVFQVSETVGIVNSEQLLRKQAVDLSDVFEDMPGVAVIGGPRGVGTRINIRGLDDSRVLFLLDGARQDFNRAHNSRVFLDPELLKRVAH